MFFAAPNSPRICNPFPVAGSPFAAKLSVNRKAIMKNEYVGLWQRIASFPIDSPGVHLPFSARLAKENGWTPEFTARAIEEYKRFAFLAIAAGHPVSPSDAVDQAWHLHLTYTQDYWRKFCSDILAKPLHHFPTEGGSAES